MPTPPAPRQLHPLRSAVLACCAAVTPALTAGCGPGDEPAPVEANEPFSLTVRAPEAAFMAVHGTASDDVWIVGADDGRGPVVLHWDGTDWTRVNSGVRADLWWVHALPDGTAFAGGSDGTILRMDRSGATRMPTPALGRQTVFGMWAAAPDDAWAVGASAGRNGFLWHWDGVAWRDVPLPADTPLDANRDLPGLFKVWGRSAGEVWIVGDAGVVLRGNATDGLALIPSGTSDRLFTVHGDDAGVYVVGGSGAGRLLSGDEAALADLTPDGAPLLQGVCADGHGGAWAVGAGGRMFRFSSGAWAARDAGVSVDAESLHAVWVDPDGGVWAVGGDVLSSALSRGVVLHHGEAVPSLSVDPAPPVAAVCPDEQIDPAPFASIARRWNEQTLNAIRRDTPRPGVHARNLYHTAIAMWDAWAAWDDTAAGVISRERIDASGLDATAIEAAREEAISFAAYRVLHHRYAHAVGGDVSSACLDAFMDRLGYDPTGRDDDGNSPRALGNRIGFSVIDAFANDGANELSDYADPDGYTSANPPLIVDLPGTRVSDPSLWQPLVLAEAVTQNGIPQGAGVQGYIGSHWRDVAPFALTRTDRDTPYFDVPGDRVPDIDTVLDAVVDVLRRGAELDPASGETIDISPRAYGNNPLGSNDGTGHPANPVTGEPYDPNVVLRGDFVRVLAEFWADGPRSETPPGHWNTLANDVSYDPAFDRRLFGEGEPLDPLAWDVHLYLALNGALHDAAIAAWELKRVWETARPITLIRYMAELGQRSDPSLPSYDAGGLPLVPGLIELITAESAAPGQRHAHLARYQGDIALFAWRGEPGDRDRDRGGVDWVRGVEWTPYQRRNFVTPAFPGFLSGHSTFSRAAAEVLAALTGTPFFPGGLGEFVAPAGYLVFEAGPEAPVRLQWATYYDAADQAGQSRIWGGIHVFPDDFQGRTTGSEVGLLALAHARSYFDGSAE